MSAYKLWVTVPISVAIVLLSVVLIHSASTSRVNGFSLVYSVLVALAGSAASAVPALASAGVFAVVRRRITPGCVIPPTLATSFGATSIVLVLYGMLAPRNYLWYGIIAWVVVVAVSSGVVLKLTHELTPS